MARDRKLVLRAAQNMINRYGDDALAAVDLRISELRVRGQHDAELLWKEIREAVEFLSDPPPNDAE